LNELEKYTKEDFEFIKRQNIRLLTFGKTSCTHPKAFLLGGQSGAGKSSLHNLAAKELENNVIVIDGDSFRSQHPNSVLITQKFGRDDVKYTAKFVGAMVESLVEELSDKGYNLVVEGTLRTIDIPAKTAHLLVQKGYNVELLVMAVKPKLSYLSTLVRYEEAFTLNPKTARSTPKEHHDLIVSHLPKNLDSLWELKIFFNIRIFKRSGELIYDQFIDLEVKPSLSLMNYWSEPMAFDEKTMFDSILERTIYLSEARRTGESESILKELMFYDD